MITRKDIKKATIDCNTTAAAIADKLGMTPQNYNSFLQKAYYTQNDLTRIADALGVRYVSAFIDESGNTIVGGACDASDGTKI